MNLENKTVFITGASSGIGKSIAELLADQGCKIILASRSADKLERISESLPCPSMVVKMDLADTKSVHQAFKSLTPEFSAIDILVNCGGVMPLSYLKNRHLDEWLQTIEVNVKGSLRCIYEVLPNMQEQKSGHIINIASVDGKELYKGGAVYGASKAAIIALSKAMRMELSPEFNIRVTAIEPGTVDTSLREDITDKELLEDKDYGEDEPKLNSDDIARAVLYALQQPQGVNVNELLIKPTGKS
ncbi:MAG: SDR family oxidoreductase [Flavobacteriaceae bacterium]|nr:SDR family oxidoreductase [Flavobacteriaceae bacterium]